MLVFWFVCALVQCLLFAALLLCGRRLLRRAEEERQVCRFSPAGGWPRIAMIIPVAGEHPDMKDALTSLLQQDYPQLLPVMVTATARETAAKLVASLQEEYPHLRHVVAGPARGCGQKNHNSLQGIAAAGHEADIYLFCDSTHLAEPDFVRCLAAPVIEGEAACSTGYHIVEPHDDQPVTLAYALSVLLMRFLQALSSFTQPWGGAMCISRQAFEQHGVAQLWATNVVDDCSLAAHLQSRGIAVRLSAAALLHTGARAHGLAVWRAWMERQVLFLKFCMPGQWMLLGILPGIMVLPPLGAALMLLGGLIGLGSASAMLPVLSWLLLLAASLGPWRAFLSRPVSLGRWLWAFACAAGMFLLVYAQSLRAREIIWKDFAYRVGRGGHVLSVRRC
ncbi:MAG: glycosyltransferase [Desulfovibrio sp.]|nr:glycosyltransferase [Desulfovibrio sp.]